MHVVCVMPFIVFSSLPDSFIFYFATINYGSLLNMEVCLIWKLVLSSTWTIDCMCSA